MPLSKPVRRQAHHTRTITCQGYLHEDDLWDIEARMCDIKCHDADNPERGGYVAAGEAFHDHRLRISIDPQLLIHRVEACIDQAPFRICSCISNAYRCLEGTRIGAGWLRLVKERLGGIEGCTHFNELLPVVATPAVQTLWPSSDEAVLRKGAKAMLNSCHVWDQSREMVRDYLPELYSAVPGEEPANERN